MKKQDIVKFKLDIMFEKRPIWSLILGLNVCILIWLISVQQPVIFDVNTAALSTSSNYIINTGTGAETGSPVAAASIDQQRGGSNGWGRDLLSKQITAQSNDYADDMSAAASNLTTLNIKNKHKRHNTNNNNSNNVYNSTATSTKQVAHLSHTLDVKSTTKTNDLSSDLLSLTSSLGTGVLDLKTKPTASLTKLTSVASALPPEDFNQLIDLHNFQFLMTQPVCGTYIEALILIHSAPKNYEKRQVIRETWASLSHHKTEFPLRVIFLLGAVNSEQLQQDLQNENNIYRDLIQGSFIDDYRNMTYKHIMAFKWFLYNCGQAQILIKVDDDVYVNTPQLIKYLKELQKNQKSGVNNSDTDNPTIATTVTPNKNTATTNNTTTNTLSSSSTRKSSSIFHKLNIFASALASDSATAMPGTLTASPPLPAFNASQKLFNHPLNLLFCQKNMGPMVKRTYRSKWRVSFKEFSERYYPPYCPGYAIVYSSDVIFRLYKAAQNSKYFWIDDVHITGVLAQKTNTTITNSSHYVLYSDECDAILTGKTDLSRKEFLFAFHSISAQKIKLLWHLQMMTIQTLNDLHYNKLTMNNNNDDDDNDVYEMHHTQREWSRNNNNDEYFADNGISSAHAYTSANGSR